jgi:hypothetical protein
MQSSDCSSCLAVLLENLGQLIGQPLLRDVRLTKGGEHRSHRTLRYAKPTTNLGNPLVRSLRRGFDKHSHLLGRKANGEVFTLQDCRTGADIANEVVRCTRGHVANLQTRRLLPW